MGKVIRFEFDDPYKTLAMKLLVREEYDIPRILTDDLYVRQLVIDEMRGQDLRGVFTDVILSQIYGEHRAIEIRRPIDMVGKTLYANLNLEKLRFYLRLLTV